MTLHSFSNSSVLKSAQYAASHVGHVTAEVFACGVCRSRRALTRLGMTAQTAMRFHPGFAATALLTVGVVFGAGGYNLLHGAEFARLRAEVETQRDGLDATRREAQREVNALATRLSELQAEANRLNALGERLTRMGSLGDGEFEFDKPVGVGGAGPVRDMRSAELRKGMDALQMDLARSGGQLSVLDALLLGRELDRQATPNRYPVAGSYITSGFGYRADPFGGGGQMHRGIDFEADHGDPVLAVGDGVVTYSGQRSGYGNVVEVDHGNGLVSRYAHNSANVAQVGDLVRGGQKLALAGSTGRSTGVHVHLEIWENGAPVNPRKYLDAAQPQTGIQTADATQAATQARR